MIANITILKQFLNYSPADLDHIGGTIIILNKVPRLKDSNWISVRALACLCVKALDEYHQNKLLNQAKEVLKNFGYKVE